MGQRVSCPRQGGLAGARAAQDAGAAVPGAGFGKPQRRILHPSSPGPRNIGLMNLFRHKVPYRAALLIACVLTVPGLAVAHTGAAHAASSPPATNLGIWTSAEDSGSYSTVSGQSPDVANYYLDWGSSYPQSFFSPAQSAGATAFLEMEPWIGSQGSNTCSGSGPTMTTIGANGSAIQSYAKSIGSAIASAGKPVIVTFAHEFNVSGQYPWAQGDCEGTTASQWVSAWDAVRNDIDSTANGLAYFMWVPNVFNGAGRLSHRPDPVLARSIQRRHGRRGRLPAEPVRRNLVREHLRADVLYHPGPARRVNDRAAEDLRCRDQLLSAGQRQLRVHLRT